jgi:hypothetical protein
MYLGIDLPAIFLEYIADPEIGNEVGSGMSDNFSVEVSDIDPLMSTEEVVTVNTFILPDDITASMLADPLSSTLNNSPLLPVINIKVEPLDLTVYVPITDIDPEVVKLPVNSIWSPATSNTFPEVVEYTDKDPVNETDPEF